MKVTKWVFFGVILGYLLEIFITSGLLFLAWGVFTPAFGLPLLTFWQFVYMLFFIQTIVCSLIKLKLIVEQIKVKI